MQMISKIRRNHKESILSKTFKFMVKVENASTYIFYIYIIGL